MSTNWRSGSETLRARVDQWLSRRASGESGTRDAQILSESPRRRITRLIGPERESLVVKEFLRTARARPARRIGDRLKRVLGASAGDREWRALGCFEALGLPAPRPLGRARLPQAGDLLAMSFVDGRSLDICLLREPAARRVLLAAVGRMIARLHAAGWCHNDLHIGNVLVAEDVPLLIDLQRAGPSVSQERHDRDIGALEFSLAHLGVSQGDRMVFRRAALGISNPKHPESRAALRRLGTVASLRAADYYRARTRRLLRAQGEFRRALCPTGRGLRIERFSQSAVAAALEAHEKQITTSGSALLKSDHRSRVSACRAQGERVVVKEVVKGNLRKRLADAWRGSPARRGWVGGHGLRVRGIPVAMPLAYVERTRFGIPTRSWLILEDLQPLPSVAELAEGESCEVPPRALADLLCRLVLRMHRRGVVHGDFQAQHILLRTTVDGPQPVLIDLEGVRFPARLGDEDRIRGLVELNASIADEVIPMEERRRAFGRYSNSLPFDTPRERVLEKIVQRSLARDQRFRAEQCREENLNCAIR